MSAADGPAGDSAAGHDIARRVRDGDVRAESVVASLLERIREVDDSVRAYLFVDADGALEAAREIDRRRQQGQALGPLAGVPVAIKDNLCTRGLPTTCASRLLEGFVPPYDATAVRRIREADGIILGKTNLDEFAMGSSCENSGYFPTRNPWNLDCVPGGSSGGSAAAVAADLATMALGSDTGGSIRQPAALCGVVGLKPTYGRVSRYGLVAFASSLDQVGPMTRNVTDAALLLGVIAGADRHDGTAVRRPVEDPLADIEAGVEGLRLGIPVEYFTDAIRPGVREAVMAAIDRLRDLGAEIREVSLPHTPYAVASYYLVANSEASSNLARFDAVRYGVRRDPGNREDGVIGMTRRSRAAGFGSEVKRRIMLGTFALSAGYHDDYYERGLRVRALLRRDFQRAFEEVDALVAPTSPIPAFALGSKADDPLEMYLCDILTASCNLAGVPGLSVPCGRNGDGLPIGLQILGRPFEESLILRVARAFERATEHHLARPALAGATGATGPTGPTGATGAGRTKGEAASDGDGDGSRS